jgi:hypothetical protein
MTHLTPRALTAAALLLAGFWFPAQAQALGDLYKLADSVSDSHLEYCGKQAVLADLRGPGRVT